MNPDALEWAAAQGAVITVQDHRHFCPYRGKWTRGGEPCRERLARATCAACFEDAAYFAGIWELTAARLRAVERMEVTVLSRYMREEMIAAGVDPARVHVVPRSYTASTSTRERRAVPACSSRDAWPRRRACDAVEAWRRSGLDLPLVMAGSGPLREWAQAAGAQVLGWVDHDRMAGLYRRAAALLMPSRWQEPFGIAGLEALTLGTPVAAWRSGGVPEWHPGGAWLVEWGDVGALAERRCAAAGGRARPRASGERRPCAAWRPATRVCGPGKWPSRRVPGCGIFLGFP
jgi:glycosyltransferase involved in cell wall biosynthesis